MCKVDLEKSKRHPKVQRLLKCKVVRDVCNRECLICKEIKMASEPDEEEIEEEGEKTKRGAKHKKRDKHMIVSKKLVCKKELIPTTESEETVCSIMEVREIREDCDEKRKGKKKADGKKASPFTYQDLLKKSEEVRKATEKKLSKNENTNCQDQGKKYKEH